MRTVILYCLSVFNTTESAQMNVEQDAMSLGEFCQRHGISRSSYYLLKKAGEAPRLMQVGDRVLISREAAADWRREREQAQLKKSTRGGGCRSRKVVNETSTVAA
jgi:predicted DNA-binding transcriptional regulator AlpA